MASFRIFGFSKDAQEREFMTRYLDSWGHDSFTFSSLSELDDIEDLSAPDIIFCEMDVLDVVEQTILKKYPNKREIQFVQLVRDQDIEAIVDAFQHKNRDCLLAPFTEKTLILATERAQERRIHIAKNLRIMRRLEKSMYDSERQLKALKSDQLAGRQMQNSLLPLSPTIRPPYYFAHKVLPSLYLSGDFINYLPALDRFDYFYLMDVSGHGASSAFITVMIRQLMRRIVRKQINDSDVESLAKAPEGFFESANRVLLENELDKHLTMFSGNIDKEKNRLRYNIGAVMPMPILIVDGKAEFLEGKGKPIGLFPNTKWEIYEMDLPEKFILIAFSDGILEIMPQQSIQEKEVFLLERLASVEANIDAVLPKLGIRPPDAPPDDVAIFMLARGYHE